MIHFAGGKAARKDIVENSTMKVVAISLLLWVAHASNAHALAESSTSSLLNAEDHFAEDNVLKPRTLTEDCDTSSLSLTLWNTDDDVAIGPLPHTIDLCKYEDIGLSIEAVIPNCVDFVKFKLVDASTDDNIVKKTEGNAPYTLGGDIDAKLDILPVDELKVPGKYYLSVNPRPGPKEYFYFNVAACTCKPPEGSDGLAEAVVKRKEMVVSASSLASEAGAKILAKGGTAADAMIAVQTVLGLVEPQSSGIAGGAFVVYYDAANDKLTTIDSREKATAAATGDRYEQFDGSFLRAWQTGLAVGVPGVPKMMEYMHETYGNQPWETLFEDAYKLAEDGFQIFPRTEENAEELLALNELLGLDRCDIDSRIFFRDPTASEYFLDGCEPKKAGTDISNPDYAKLMKLLSEEGSDGFYKGAVAEAIVEAVTTDPHVPGDITLDDLLAYDIVEREPVCCDYKGYDVCGMGPPSSGALAICQQLGMLETFDDLTSKCDPLDEELIHRVALAGRLAFADRGLYVGDSDFITVPIEGMLDKEYLAERASMIGEVDFGTAMPGEIDGFDPNGPADSRAKTSGTSHISIVDKYGNVLSMTTTVESFFGNGVMVPEWGFLLNNQLTDFSFEAESSDGIPIANRVEPGKRPRSSMSPTIVFDDGKPVLATGSPGGSRIIGYTLNTILFILNLGYDPQQAINVPHFLNRNGDTELEEPKAGVNLDYDLEPIVAALTARNHSVSVIGGETSGLSLIQIMKEKLVGGSDKRRDGAVSGQ